MRLDQGPVFRKTIIPWYDSEAVCWGLIAFLTLVAGFGLVGVRVAMDHLGWQGHVWVPALLVVMSLVVIVSTALRLARRYAYRYTQ